MNIFCLDRDPQKAAYYHCDKHASKMILEHVQMMCTILNEQKVNTPYKTVHKNHPCTRWLRESINNWIWVRDLTFFLNEECKFRNEHNRDHKSFTVMEGLPLPRLPVIEMTPFALAMPDDCKTDDPVESYRNYYRLHKTHIHNWKRRKKPSWL
jgi:hypothetical protein